MQSWFCWIIVSCCRAHSELELELEVANWQERHVDVPFLGIDASYKTAAILKSYRGRVV
jgi:hypothetical protein